MIKVDRGSIAVSGMSDVVRAELSTLIFTLFREDVLSEEDIREIFDRGISRAKEFAGMSDEEMNDKLKEDSAKNSDKLEDILDDIVKTLKKFSEED